MSTPMPEVLDQWHQFRSARNAELAQEHGWLTLTSLQWLPEQPSPVEIVPGLWSADDTAAALSASAADSLILADTGVPVEGTITASLNDGESLSWVYFGGSNGRRILVELARRGGRYAIRTRDAASAVFTDFDGVPTFDFRPDLVIEGRFEAYPQPVDVPIRTANPAVGDVHRTVGEVVLQLPGTQREYRLQVGSEGPNRLALTFHDGTNNHSTAGWRKVAFDAPAPGTSAVTVDFNRAVNYPSAFTDFGTCPMPVGSNIIEEPLEAGEKIPGSRR